MTAVLTRNDIVSTLCNILQRATNDRIAADEVSETDDVLVDLGLTSLEMLELSFEIESAWGIVLDNENVFQVRTVSDVIDLILRRTARQAA
jgi:acyl carrier protein